MATAPFSVTIERIRGAIRWALRDSKDVVHDVKAFHARMEPKADRMIDWSRRLH
jgi:hypothetical protein